MPAGEFDLIDRFFINCGNNRADVLQGIGDDCALLQPPSGKALAVSTDTLNVGVHFLPEHPAADIGYKSLAVSLSDLAAAGAVPAWATLAISLPESDENWLEQFAKGFCQLAREHNVALIGGDTTRGPLSITVQVTGFVDPDTSPKRTGANPGDQIYVSGELGGAALALLAAQGLPLPLDALPALHQRLQRPEPKLALGQQLAGIASACIDISDGLSSDLTHILNASKTGATVYVDQIPIQTAVSDYIKEYGDWSLPLSGGDDYELCFTVPEAEQAQMQSICEQHHCHWIGQIEKSPGLRWIQSDGNILNDVARGYDHFSDY